MAGVVVVPVTYGKTVRAAVGVAALYVTLADFCFLPIAAYLPAV